MDIFKISVQISIYAYKELMIVAYGRCLLTICKSESRPQGAMVLKFMNIKTKVSISE